jgi:transcriptional regulator with XRE-family HTH domain
MKERIKKYIEYKGISAGDLSTKLDVQRSNISHILNGRNKPGAAFIEKLLLSFTDLNARWLLTGQGEMISLGEEKNTSATSEIPFPEEMPGKEAPAPQQNEVMGKKLEGQTISEKVKKMILLFDDGTFATYKNREK